jgi:prepilin-type N-terminal cleavage/methylation domain-containing protein
MRPQGRGFSLLEVMIVVAIILAIASIAIPSYMSAIQRAHEAAAVGYLRALITAQEAYHADNDEYADKFASLGPYLSSALLSPPGANGWPSASMAFALTVAAPLQSKVKTSKAPGGGSQGPGKHTYCKRLDHLFHVHRPVNRP